MSKLSIIAVAAAALLSGCAGTKWDTTAGGTPITVAGINQVLAGTAEATARNQQQAMAVLAQSQAYRGPEVAAVKQPDGSIIIYCRGLTDQLVACRQIK